MYRSGHYGAALVGYAPFGVVVAVYSSLEVAIVAGGATLALTVVPDYDHRVPGLDHRGATHTVGFALLVAGVTGTVGWVLGAGVAPFDPVSGGVLGGTVGLVAILAHLVADAITPAGVRPFWPVSAREYGVGWIGAANPVANYGLLCLGVLVALGAVAVCLRVAGG